MTGRPSFRGLSELPPDQADLRREQQTERAITTSLPDWLRDGKVVSLTLTDATAGSVAHGLRRGVKGWLPIGVSGDANLVNLVQSSGDGEKLTLVNKGATGTLVVRLWVY